MTWSSYPYENPNIDTYIEPVLVELYQAIDERKRIANYILFKDVWRQKKSYAEVIDILSNNGSRRGYSTAVRRVWAILKDCLTMFKDEGYVSNGANDDKTKFFIYQTWLGIENRPAGDRVGYLGFTREDEDFFDYYASLFNEELNELKAFVLGVPMIAGDKSLCSAGIIRDMYLVLKNCLNSVVGWSDGRQIRNPTIDNDYRMPTIRNIGYGYSIAKGDDADGFFEFQTASEAYNNVRSNFLSGPKYDDDDTVGGTIYPPTLLSTTRVVEEVIFDVPQDKYDATLSLSQIFADIGNKVIDYTGAFYDYKDRDISTIHTRDSIYGDGVLDYYENYNMPYVGSDGSLHSCPIVRKNNMIVMDNRKVVTSDVYDFNISSASRDSIKAGANLQVIGSYININEEGALEYYTEPSN